jgi:hypothetical protein
LLPNIHHLADSLELVRSDLFTPHHGRHPNNKQAIGIPNALPTISLYNIVLTVQEHPVNIPLPDTWRGNVVFACLLNDPEGTRILNDFFDTLYDKMEVDNRQQTDMQDASSEYFELDFRGRAIGKAICGTVMSANGQRMNRLNWYEKVRVMHDNPVYERWILDFE